jgi:branched-chain amino acid transport system substrate-binding protein
MLQTILKEVNYCTIGVLSIFVIIGCTQLDSIENRDDSDKPHEPQGSDGEKSSDTWIESELFSEECTRVYGASATDLETFDQNTILLGSILPTTGDLKTRGRKMEQAVELAVDEINMAGGILGKKIAVLFCDSATSYATAKRAMMHLIDLERVPAVIGPADSAVVIETFTDVAKEAKLLVMSPFATSPQITDLSDNDLLWRTAPSDAIQGAAIANYLLEEGSFHKIAIVNRNDTYGNGIRDAIALPLCDTFPCTDAMRFYNSVYDKKTWEKDQSKIVAELEEFEPGITVVIGYFEDGGAFLELTKDTKMDRFVLTDGLDSDKLKDLDLSDKQLCRLVGTRPGLPSSRNYQSFSLRFSAKYGEVEPYTANAYDATYLIAYAIAATDTSRPTGPDVAKGLRRLSKGETISPGTFDWDVATQMLSSSPDATINYEGASGPLDFDENGEAPSDIEGWAFNTDDLATFSLGTAYTSDGVYNDVFKSVSGQGEACGNITGKACNNTLDCNDGDYCDKSQTPAVCTPPPSGQGEPCSSDADCEGYEADYCDTLVSYTCMKQGCSEELNDCSDDRICCDYAWLGLPSLCIDKAESNGLCAKGIDCVTNDDCQDGTFCDLTSDVSLCVSNPFGQGEPCETHADCSSYSADYCETMVSHTCLYQGCDKEVNNCSEGYRCCDFSSLGLPALCIEEGRYETECVETKK